MHLSGKLAIGVFLASVAVVGVARADDMVDALSKDPQRLRQVLHECRQKQDADKDPLCIAASKAWRARFFGAPHKSDSGQAANPPSTAPAPAHP